MGAHNANVTVLVVADEPLLRMALADTLDDAGFKVLEATNADDAIVILDRDRAIQLVFTDIAMSGSMDGLKLAAAI
ncbi:response regulator [Pararhizobium sp. A13]|uniref:response regulator n=1 Tax=Pararhizobium sp. A13 TaxID=3133975 RepID=UPI00311ADB5D